jgi:hypothetical protein
MRGELTTKIRFLFFGGFSHPRQQIPKINAENVGDVPEPFTALSG